MDNNLIEDLEGRMSMISSSFISDMQDRVDEYKDAIAGLLEETEGEMDAIKDDLGKDDAVTDEGYQELDGLYDSLDDILSSIKIIKDALEEIRNYT